MSFVSIEGNIGAGKSTFVELLKEVLNPKKYTFLQEPVDEWLNMKDSDGENILEKFYKNKSRWSYSFQMNAFITRLKRLENALNSKNLVICERTIETDRNCFAKELFESKNISKMEWELYNQWYYWLKDKTPTNPIGIIYLKCDPKICSERIKKRERKEECSIPLKYLENIHQKPETWIANIESNGGKVLILDVNVDFEKHPESKEHLVQKISVFLNELINKKLNEHQTQLEKYIKDNIIYYG